jgi:hypothetical protein
MRLRGQEIYWIEYLNLIEAASHGRNVEDALDQVEQGFIKRNSDKRITDDNYETDGSGTHPVRWDYRRDSLMAYICQL